MGLPLLALLGAMAASAQPAPLQRGFSEAVITTADPDRWSALLVEHGGWEVRDRRALSDGEKALWQLPARARGQTVLMANRDEDTGFIRLVRIEGVAQEMIRADDRPWDTGGIFDLNIRVVGMDALRQKLHSEGWQGDSPPIRYRFGTYEVVEWVARGPDGVRLAFIERLDPPLEGWPKLKKMSRVFNATTIVRDMGATKAFFQGVLGMKPYMESNKPSAAPEPNVLGLPWNVSTMIARDVAILHPTGANEGSVEFVQFVGAQGADMRAAARPGNLGISTLRFRVDNLDASLDALRAAGMALPVAAQSLDLAPYGRVRITGFTTPDGVWLEMFETTGKAAP
jgi:catechol 2,3-dioxygenase-like lactoylglutathione lyase family enzyme